MHTPTENPFESIRSSLAGKGIVDRLSFHNVVFGYSEGGRRDDLFPSREVEQVLNHSCANRGRVSDAEYHEAGDILFGSIDRGQISSKLRAALRALGMNSANDVASMRALQDLVRQTGLNTPKLLYTAFDPAFKARTGTWKLENHREHLARILEDESYVKLAPEIQEIVDGVGRFAVGRSVNN